VAFFSLCLNTTAMILEAIVGFLESFDFVFKYLASYLINISKKAHVFSYFSLKSSIKGNI
jgi:hypothetical protein